MPNHKNSPLIILGSPRSGTSLIAGALDAAGITMGRRFLDSDHGNRQGYFEDLDFLELHQEFLSRSAFESNKIFDDGSMRTEAFPFEPLENDLERAHILISERNSQGQPWGWKDPRTCLFLPFWKAIVPNARYFLIYRHPIEVSASLLRLAKNWDLAPNPRLGVDAWTFQMREVLKFFGQEPVGRTLIANAAALIGDIDSHIEHIQTWCDTQLDTSAFKAHIDPEIITQTRLTPSTQRAFARFFPEAAEIFETLQKHCTRPMEWSPDSDSEADTLLNEKFDSATALAILQNRVQPAAAEQNNQAREDQRAQTIHTMRYRFAQAEVLQHKASICDQALDRIKTEQAALKARLQQEEHTNAEISAQNAEMSGQIQRLQLSLQQATELKEIAHSSLPSACFNLFGRALSRHGGSAPTGLRKWQIERATHSHWETIGQKIRRNQCWLINALNFLTLTKEHEALFRETHWQAIADDVTSRAHLGTMAPESCEQLFSGVQYHDYNRNEAPAFLPIRLAYYQLASRLKMPSHYGEQWSQQHVSHLANLLRPCQGFVRWLEKLQQHKARWFCSGLHGFETDAIQTLLHPLKLPLHPDVYLSLDGIPQKVEARSVFDHWMQKLELNNWRKIHHLGTSVEQDFDWPREAGIRRCHLIVADQPPQSPSRTSAEN